MIRNNATLKARIERLEKRTSARRVRRMTFGLFDRDESNIIGVEADVVGSSRPYVMRQPDEATSALIERAYNVTGALSLRIVYAQARQPRQEREDRRSATHAAPDTLTASDGLPSDPYALAGIGRAASKDELIRMGAIPLPCPERLI
ncbi:MAG: hypothetical protein WKF52_03505 [Sphingomicrobium sp.]